MFRNSIKRVVPRPLRLLVRDWLDGKRRREARMYRKLAAADAALETLDRDVPAEESWTRVLGHGVVQAEMARLELRRYRYHMGGTIDYSTLHNQLVNSGPLQAAAAYSSAREIVAAYPDASHRSLGEELTAGFALDDAVFDEGAEYWEQWSYVKLAAWLAKFACQHFANPALLELGCGPAHLFFYFRRWGLHNYVGIDGNPYFVQFNRHLQSQAPHFLTLNLQEKIHLAHQVQSSSLQFDLIIAFELLEHIQESAVDNLLWTMQAHMHANSVAFCSASLQEAMDVHILVRSREWWLNRFAHAGLAPAKNADRLIQAMLARQPFNWGNSTNVFALVKRSRNTASAG